MDGECIVIVVVVVVGECLSGGMEEKMLMNDIVWANHHKIYALL